MLKEINCTHFIEEKIIFTDGLNAVLGDDISTNSIGKSTFLMIIDFVFGGDSYTDHDSGSKSNVGEQEFFFEFQFDSIPHFFNRGTASPNSVSRLDEKKNVLKEMSISEFRKFLKDEYRIQSTNLGFRPAISTYSRIWGKDNYKVDKPIQSFPAESDSKSITTLIKLFNRYTEISEEEDKIKDKEEDKKILDGVHKRNFVEKLSKTDFKKNQLKLEEINNQVQDIQENLLEYTLNIEELVDKDVIKLKVEKSKLLRAKNQILNKVEKINLNLGEKRIKSKHLNKLSTFFDNPNEAKIEEIESFHNKIGTILQRELKAARKILQEELILINEKIDLIDGKTSSILSNVKSPKFIVDKIYDLTIESNRIQTKNRFYSDKIEVIESINTLNKRLETTVISILEAIELQINTELILINKKIHSEQKKVPHINLNRKSYSYDHSNNTGTGKSFTDLIEFDLTILSITDLPLLIHDSVVFKNVGDVAMDRVIKQYDKKSKQIFIAMDGINKFAKETQETLLSKSCLSLSEKRTLFNLDWS